MNFPHRPIILNIALICAFLTGCRSKEHVELYPPGNDKAFYIEYRLQNMDQLRYWQNLQLIRLQSGIIQLYPGSSTYLKKFIGTPVPGDPSEERWAVEESGSFLFSPDSAYLLFSNDHDTAFYFKGFSINGMYHPPSIEQYDSLWYSDFIVSMGVSGRFYYVLK